MPKKTANYSRCEHCDRILLEDSPPIKEAYEQGRIHIESGSMLLPKAVVEARHREGFADSHVEDISGSYCDKDCLLARLLGILKRRR